MIVGGTKPAETPAQGRRATLDDLFRRAAVRSPDAPALADPADRAWFTDGEPRTLTFAQADRIVWAIAARLRRLGLQTDAAVAVQLPNTVESVLALLGILRAGMVAAPLPMLWRPAEIAAALSGTGVKAILTTARIGETAHGDVAMAAAAHLFSVRHVCAFGKELPDGITALDDLLSPSARDILPPANRSQSPAEHAAVITFEPTPRGIRPVLRNHVQLIAGGIGVFMAAGLTTGTNLLSATPISSFAGLAATLMPWLLSGGCLVLHQPFDPATFVAAQQDHQCGAVVIPGPLIDDSDELHLFDSGSLQSVIALWRAPERATSALTWQGPQRLADIHAFGEIGLVARARQANGDIAPLTEGQTGDSNGIELRRTDGGTLALRGGSVARLGNAPVPPDDGFVDTRYPCRLDGSRLRITGPQPGMVGIGGYRLPHAELDAAGHDLPLDSLIAALPDELLGQRLKGRSTDQAAAVARARSMGPLIASAFALRGQDAA